MTHRTHCRNPTTRVKTPRHLQHKGSGLHEAKMRQRQAHLDAQEARAQELDQQREAQAREERMHALARAVALLRAQEEVTTHTRRSVGVYINPHHSTSAQHVPQRHLPMHCRSGSNSGTKSSSSNAASRQPVLRRRLRLHSVSRCAHDGVICTATVCPPSIHSSMSSKPMQKQQQQTHAPLH